MKPRLSLNRSTTGRESGTTRETTGFNWGGGGGGGGGCGGGRAGEGLWGAGRLRGSGGVVTVQQCAAGGQAAGLLVVIRPLGRRRERRARGQSHDASHRHVVSLSGSTRSASGPTCVIAIHYSYNNSHYYECPKCN